MRKIPTEFYFSNNCRYDDGFSMRKIPTESHFSKNCRYDDGLSRIKTPTDLWFLKICRYISSSSRSEMLPKIRFSKIWKHDGSFSMISKTHRQIPVCLNQFIAYNNVFILIRFCYISSLNSKMVQTGDTKSNIFFIY